MARVLVTGGTGFIGSHIVRALRSRGDEVALFVRDAQKVLSTHANERTVLADCEIFEGDIRTYADVLGTFTSFKPELVFHTAAALSRGTTGIDEQDAILINQEGTQHVVDAIAHMKDLSPVRGAIMFGSSVEYGVSSKPLQETMECNPVGSYAVSKYRGTLYAMKKAEEESLPIVSLRVFTPYGSGMSANSFVSIVLTRAGENKDITLAGTSVTRDFIYIDDLVALALELVERAHAYPGQIFNGGGGHATTLYDFATRVVEMSASHSSIMLDEKFLSPQDAGIWQADMTKTLGIVDWRPQVEMNTGIARLLSRVPR